MIKTPTFISIKDVIPPPLTMLLIRTDMNENQIAYLNDFSFSSETEELSLQWKSTSEFKGEVTHWFPMPIIKNQ